MAFHFNHQIMTFRAAYSLVIALISIPPLVSSDTASMSNGKPNGKFGFVGKFLRVPEVDGFPNSMDFFRKFAIQSKPVLMRGAAKWSPAFDLWQDEYFLNLDIPEDEYYAVETMKKENKSQEVLELNFREFLQAYKNSERYLVNRLPPFLSKDILLPHPLQCPDIYRDSILDSIMFFSSGDTNGLVHIDAVDNINCVYAGDKYIVMVDPDVYGDQVIFDHPEGEYLGLDVDHVDYEKYPDLLSVEYYHVHVKAGDCLFIPYRWIHQVRSSGPRNIAVSTWWNKHHNQNFDLSECSPTNDQNLTLDKIEFADYDEMLHTVSAIRDEFLSLTRHLMIRLEKYLAFVLDENDVELAGDNKEYELPLRMIFQMIDSDEDGIMSHQEVKQLEDKDWEEVIKHLDKHKAIIAALHRHHDENNVKEDHQNVSNENHDEL